MALFQNCTLCKVPVEKLAARRGFALVIATKQKAPKLSGETPLETALKLHYLQSCQHRQQKQTAALV